MIAVSTLTTMLTKQRPAPPYDESFFDTASLVFRTDYDFDATPQQVWDVLDGDDMFDWLPFPGVGVTYESSERGVGIVREMGSVASPFRFLWIQRERFLRHDEPEQMTYAAISGTWIYTLLVRHYAENMTLSPTPGGGTTLTWTVATTPRLPFRFVKYLPSVWRLAYRANFGRPVAQRLIERTRGAIPRDRTALRTGH